MKDNIRLLEALLRIYNGRLIMPNKEEKDILLPMIRNIIEYIHLPSTPMEVPFWDLLPQYAKAYPDLKLSHGIMKAVVKEGNKRIKI